MNNEDKIRKTKKLRKDNNTFTFNKKRNNKNLLIEFRLKSEEFFVFD